MRMVFSLNFVLQICDFVPPRNHSRKLQLMISVSFTDRADNVDLQSYSLTFFQEFTFSTTLVFVTLQTSPIPYILSTDTSLSLVYQHIPAHVFQAQTPISSFLTSSNFTPCLRLSLSLFSPMRFWPSPHWSLSLQHLECEQQNLMLGCMLYC